MLKKPGDYLKPSQEKLRNHVFQTNRKIYCSHLVLLSKNRCRHNKEFLKNYFREKQKNKPMVKKTDKNKHMRLIKENKEIIEMSVLNKSEISKGIF